MSVAGPLPVRVPARRRRVWRDEPVDVVAQGRLRGRAARHRRALDRLERQCRSRRVVGRRPLRPGLDPRGAARTRSGATGGEAILEQQALRAGPAEVTDRPFPLCSRRLRRRRRRPSRGRGRGKWPRPTTRSTALGVRAGQAPAVPRGAPAKPPLRYDIRRSSRPNSPTRALTLPEADRRTLIRRLKSTSSGCRQPRRREANVARGTARSWWTCTSLARSTASGGRGTGSTRAVRESNGFRDQQPRPNA